MEAKTKMVRDWNRAPVRLEKTSEIVWDLQVYPREQVDQAVVRNYARALKAGATFPNVKIGILAGEKVIVDGLHRIKAHELNKIGYVTCSELPFANQAEIFAEAVKLNATHGKSFTEKEVRKNIERLQKFKFSVKDIQRITSVPASEIYRESAAPMITLITPAGKKINCNECEAVGQPTVYETIQFKNALQLIRDVANKRCIPDDPYFETLVSQCLQALQKMQLNNKKVQPNG